MFLFFNDPPKKEKGRRCLAYASICVPFASESVSICECWGLVLTHACSVLGQESPTAMTHTLTHTDTHTHTYIYMVERQRQGERNQRQPLKKQKKPPQNIH